MHAALAAIVQMHEQGGIDGLRSWLAEGELYRAMCPQRPA